MNINHSSKYIFKQFNHSPIYLELNCIGAEEKVFIEFEESNELETSDLETIGLGRNIEITQIVGNAGEEAFRSYMYVVTRCNITMEFSNITGMTNCCGSITLYLHDKAVCVKTQS